MTEENNRVKAGIASELPLDFDTRQSFAEPPHAPFKSKQESSPVQEVQPEIPAAAVQQPPEPESEQPTAAAEQTETAEKPAAEKPAAPSAPSFRQGTMNSNTVLPGTAPVPPPGTPVRRPAPIIAAGHRNVGIATQSIGQEKRSPVVCLAANELPGAEKNVEILPYGRIFAEARKRSGKTLEEVGNLTLIRSDYIKALEAEDLNNLPAVTYVIAYARKLGKLYNMPREQVNDLVGTIRSRLEYVVPEELIVRLGESGDPSEENIRTIRKFMMLSGIAAGVTVLIIAGIIAAAAWGYTSEEETSYPVASDTVAGEFIGQPTLEMPELKPR